MITIQNEILEDTQYSALLLRRNNVKDSLKNKVMGNEMSYDRLSTDELKDISFMSFGTEEFRSSNNGFEQLMGSFPDNSKKYAALIAQLNFVYEILQDDMDVIGKVCVEVSPNYKDYLANNQDWYGNDNHTGEISEAQSEYYLNNPRFKNHIFHLLDYLVNL